MAIFSDDMARYGHEYAFLPQDRAQSRSIPSVTTEIASCAPTALNGGSGRKSFSTRKQDDINDLVDILHPQQSLDSTTTAILPWLNKVYKENRGFELGTFNSSILATTMMEQSSKWSDISLAYVSDVIVIVHNFITTALEAVCPNDDMRHALFGIMADDLIARYQNAIDHTTFLLRVENVGMPMTMNHYFNDNLQKRYGSVSMYR